MCVFPDQHTLIPACFCLSLTHTFAACRLFPSTRLDDDGCREFFCLERCHCNSERPYCEQSASMRGASQTAQTGGFVRVCSDWCRLLTGSCQQLRVLQVKRLITQPSGPFCPRHSCCSQSRSGRLLIKGGLAALRGGVSHSGSSGGKHTSCCSSSLEIFGRLVHSSPRLVLLSH